MSGALIFGGAGGCGLLSGLDGYSACADDCSDGPSGAPAPTSPTTPEVPDATTGEGSDVGATGDEPSPETVVEAGTESTDAGAQTMDAVTPALPDASLPPRDASPEASRPDSGGCGCEASSCCAGGTCQTAHSNGVGQTFSDCEALGTFTQTQAQEACLAFTGTSTECVEAPTGVCGSSRAICSNGAATCWCWTYAGTAAGTVEKQVGLCPSACPNPSGTMWN